MNRKKLMELLDRQNGQEQFLPPKSDVAFKELMRNEIVRRQFISDVLGIPLQDIRRVYLENTFLGRRSKRDKEGILDVRLTLNSGWRINIELQIRQVLAWDKRSLFYLSKMYAEKAHSGEDYDRLKKCVVICILGFPWNDRPGCHKVYHLRDQDGELYSDQFEVHTIELGKELTGDVLDDWIRLFRVESMEELRTLQSTNQGVMEAVREVMEMNLGQYMRALYEEHMRIKRDRLYLRNNAIREGKAMGHAEGIAQGELLRSRQAILDLLEDLGNIPTDILDRIQAEEDTEILRRWLKTAARAESIASFRENL